MPTVLKARYQIELLSDYEEWWRYNVYIMAVGFNEEGGEGTFNNLVDKVYDVNHDDDTRRFAPDNYKHPRIIKFTTEECAFVDIYIYVVTNTFPLSEIIGDSPSFITTLRVSANGRLLEEEDFEVNQWGGLTVVGHRVDATKILNS